MQIKPVSPALGATVTGVDLSRPLRDQERRAILEAWRHYHLLVFPNQEIGDEQHADFCELFGPVQVESDGRRFGYVTNRGESGFVTDEQFEWHMDYCFTPYPSLAISLYAQTLPVQGTATWFASNIHGWQTLPEPLRSRVRTLAIQNMGDFERGDQMARLYLVEGLNPANPSIDVPLVREHPASGQEQLYCCHMMTARVLSLSEQESRELLRQLFDHIYARENVYQHRWEPGQLVVWDNVALQHARPQSLLSHGERTLRRVCVAERNAVEYLAPFWAAYDESRSAKECGNV